MVKQTTPSPRSRRKPTKPVTIDLKAQETTAADKSAGLGDSAGVAGKAGQPAAKPTIGAGAASASTAPGAKAETKPATVRPSGKSPDKPAGDKKPVAAATTINAKDNPVAAGDAKPAAKTGSPSTDAGKAKGPATPAAGATKPAQAAKVQPANSAPRGLSIGLLAAVFIVALAGAMAGVWFMHTFGHATGLIAARNADPDDGLQASVQQLFARLGEVEHKLTPETLQAAVIAAIGENTGEIGQLPADAASAIAELGENITALEAKFSAAETGGVSTNMSGAIEQRISAVETALAAAREQTVTPGIDPAALAKVADALEHETNAAAAARLSLTQDIEAELAALRERLSGLDSQIGADLQVRLSAVEHLASENAAETRVAGAIAASALKSAIDRGDPYTAPLTAVETTIGKSNWVEKLRPYAKRGIPTLGELQNRFSRIAGEIIASQNRGDEQGLMSRLFNNARELVSVRKIGDVEGDSLEAVVARIENDLNAGRSELALERWGELPDAAKQMSAQWKADLDMRITADAYDPSVHSLNGAGIVPASN